MPRNYVTDIQTKDITDLRAMFSDVMAGRAIDRWAPGKAFEHIILRAFQIGGAVVKWPYSVRDNNIEIEQIDGIVYYKHLFCLVEAKDYNEEVNIEPIAKLRNQLMRRPGGTMGLIFSREGFTPSAKSLARYASPLNILMWEGRELEEVLDKDNICQALITKFMYAVEQGVPDYNVVAGI